jgi:hypothetical protein
MFILLHQLAFMATKQNGEFTIHQHTKNIVCWSYFESYKQIGQGEGKEGKGGG